MSGVSKRKFLYFKLYINNLSKKFTIKSIRNQSLDIITETGWYSGDNIKELASYKLSWCMIHAMVQSDNAATIYVSGNDGKQLIVVKRNSDGTYLFTPCATKSDLSAYATNAQLQSTFINISNKRYVKITASENNSNYGIIFAVTSQGILCVYSVNGNFTTLFESTGNRVKISASGLVTTIDCAASYTHGFILRGGSLKNMPYEIS